VFTLETIRSDTFCSWQFPSRTRVNRQRNARIAQMVAHSFGTPSRFPWKFESATKLLINRDWQQLRLSMGLAYESL
jgi:hypothetical protein